LDFRDRMSAGAVFVVSAVILSSWKPLHRFLPVLDRIRMRTAVSLTIVAGGLGVMMLLQFIPESASVPIPFTILLGTLLPGAVAASLVFGLEEAAYRKVVTKTF
jgi:hypothetical protein